MLLQLGIVGVCAKRSQHNLCRARSVREGGVTCAALHKSGERLASCSLHIGTMALRAQYCHHRADAPCLSGMRCDFSTAGQHRKRTARRGQRITPDHIS